MKYFSFCIFLLLSYYSNAQTKIKIPKDAVKGDFNGDGKTEYMWLVPPKLNEDEMDCIGDCNSFIQFSNPKIARIKVKNCIGGQPVNLGDLNNDSKDEIGLLPSWFTSCWHSFYVWTFKNKNWIYAVDPIITHCSQWEDGVKVIEKHPTKKGYVIIRFSDITDDDLKIKTKTIRIK